MDRGPEPRGLRPPEGSSNGLLCLGLLLGMLLHLGTVRRLRGSSAGLVRVQEGSSNRLDNGSSRRYRYERSSQRLQNLPT